MDICVGFLQIECLKTMERNEKQDTRLPISLQANALTRNEPSEKTDNNNDQILILTMIGKV